MENNKIEKNKSSFGTNENTSSRNRKVLEIGIERYVSLGNLIYNWKIAFFSMLSVSILLFISSIYLFTSRSVYPYIITVDKHTGEVISSEVLKSSNVEISKKEIEYFMKKFIFDTRTITTDKNFFNKSLKNSNTFLTSDTQKKIITILSNENVNSFFIDGITRDVEILSFNSVSETKNTYQIRWREKEFDKSGQLIKRRNMNAILKLDFFVPKPEQIQFNPFGIAISDYNQSQEN